MESNATNQQPARAIDTTQQSPWSVKTLCTNIASYIERMPELWVEGQVVEYSSGKSTRINFFVLRDLQEQFSIKVKAFPNVVSNAGPAFDNGTRVVMQVKPDFYAPYGQLAMSAKEIHTVGIGDLLARIEQLRQKLQAEGLFDKSRKKPLPFIPNRVGLICGHKAKAKDDVIRNAHVRWPATAFEIREVAVQGQYCVEQVTAAIAELDALAEVDVIVVARGGGAVEDLLPFSDEAIVRAVAAARTPIVSAIGHEADCPLMDFAADYRASTPTDAARRIVPDVDEQRQGLQLTLSKLRLATKSVLDREISGLENLQARPVFRSPAAAVEAELERLEGARQRLRSAVKRQLDLARQQLAGQQASLRALSPQQTLQRGYSILKTPSGHVISDSAEVKKGDLMEAILGQGSLVASVVGTNTANAHKEGEENE